MRQFVAVLLLSVASRAQSSINLQIPSTAPAKANSSIEAFPPSELQLPSAPTPQQVVSANKPARGSPVQLSLKDAQTIALRQNPQISVGRLLALASQQVARETRSNLWPNIRADLTAVDSLAGSRITAGALNNPIIFERAAAGASVSQLITDFGHTTNLVSSASLAAKAQDQNALATKEQILLAVDQAFYGALQAHAVLTVAQQTVHERQTVADQVDALYKNQLKSQVDYAFAEVNLAQAKLLLLDAQNNENATFANLSAVLGYSAVQNFQLVEDTTPLVAPPANVDSLISDAFAARPEIRSLNYQYQSAQKFQKAQRDLFFPTINALAAVGDTPVRIAPLTSWYWAAGVNLGIPVFNGFRYSAMSKEASLQEEATRQRLLDLKNTISRDVRNSWLGANTAYQRLSVTQQLLDQADLSLNLAQTRYNLGLGSIVELSQAQLQQTQAQIGYAQAGYDYRLALAMLQYQTTGL
jgi:outer membrane protein